MLLWLSEFAISSQGGNMKLGKLLALALAAAFVWTTGANADVLDDVKKRGKLVVGVKADYKPFGFRDPSGAIVGLEPDLAADVAKKLGVELELDRKSVV